MKNAPHINLLKFKLFFVCAILSYIYDPLFEKERAYCFVLVGQSVHSSVGQFVTVSFLINDSFDFSIFLLF